MNKNSGLMFKPDMILAYLQQRKNQTRRTKGLDLINQNPDQWHFNGYLFNGVGAGFASFSQKGILGTKTVRLPYGGVGDSLYFKETWKMFERDEDGKDFLHYRADDAKVFPVWWTKEEWTRPDPVWAGRFDKWQSSMFMPRICSRFRKVPILNVRVERLQDISEEDSYNEGISGGDSMGDPIGEYIKLWDTINGKILPAKTNPYVFVYEFPRLHDKEK